MRPWRSFVSALVAILVAGCEMPPRPIPVERHLAGIDYRKPTQGQCDCGFVPGVSAAYVVNQTDRTISATVRISSYFTSGTYIDSRPETNILQPRQSKFLACSRTVNEGITTTSPTVAECNIRNEFKPISEVYYDRAFLKTELTALADEARQGPEFCQRECRSGTPNCLALSSDYGELTGPVRVLVEQADNQGTGKVSKTDLLKAYGMSEADDQCGRDGVSLDQKYVVNEGPSECSIRSVAVASLFARSARIETRLSALNSSPDLSLRIPKTVRMTKAQRNLFDQSARTLGIFEDLNEAFFLSFREPLLSFAGKAEIDDQNNRFSGHFRDASEITYGPANQRAIVLSTSRGCLMFDAPRS
jgi:hypothetical protein